VIVKKRQRRLTGVDEIVLSLTAKGLTTGEIAAHFDDVYGATVSKDTISRITDKVIEEMTQWCNRPLDSVYPVVFIDAIFVKVRDGQVTNRPRPRGLVLRVRQIMRNSDKVPETVRFNANTTSCIETGPKYIWSKYVVR